VYYLYSKEFVTLLDNKRFCGLL